MDVELTEETEVPNVEKPAMKRRVKHYGVYGDRKNIVSFDTDAAIAKDLEYFGKVFKDSFSGGDNLYYIVVDGRFDMAEVLAYMDSLNENGEVVEVG